MVFAPVPPLQQFEETRAAIPVSNCIKAEELEWFCDSKKRRTPRGSSFADAEHLTRWWERSTPDGRIETETIIGPMDQRSCVPGMTSAGMGQT
jgi:hypothetical protein